MSAVFEIVLNGGVEAPRAARHAIAEKHPTLPQPVQDDVSLLVTELVPNAVRHGGAADDRPVRVGFRSREGRIRVEVVDPGTASTRRRGRATAPGVAAGDSSWSIELQRAGVSAPPPLAHASGLKCRKAPPAE